ncbi:MAG: hypothetical protein JSS76_07955 [Bacteroidetes bacterium]|nr:hypothetical protein [Bacteroidota bacterium]
MITMLYRGPVLISIFLLALSAARAGAGVISEIPLEIKANKAPFFSFSGTCAKYILLRDKSDLVIVHLDSTFHSIRTVRYDLDQVLNVAEPLAAAETGPYVTILMSDKSHEHFSTIRYHIQSGEVRKGVNFDTDDYDYFGWYPRKNEIMMLAVKRKTSLLSILSIDSAGPAQKYNFELDDVRFKRYEQTTLYSTLSSYPLTTIAADEYVSDVNTTSYAKLYYGQDTVAISLSVRLDSTQLILLDLPHHTFTNLLVPNLVGKVQVDDQADGNAFLRGHLLTTVFVYSHTINVGVYDIFQQKYIVVWSSNGNLWDSLVSGPLLYENLQTLTQDTVTNRDKFVSHLFTLPILSVATDITGDGMDIYVAGLGRLERSGGGVVMSPGGGVMMAAPMGGSFGGPMLWPRQTARDEDIQLRKHYYFVSRVDITSFKKSKPGVIADNYQKLNMSYFDSLHDMERYYICRFRQGDKFYLGYYSYDEKNFFIRGFK